jgi:hypothetical protein
MRVSRKQIPLCCPVLYALQEQKTEARMNCGGTIMWLLMRTRGHRQDQPGALNHSHTLTATRSGVGKDVCASQTESLYEQPAVDGDELVGLIFPRH